MHLSAIGYLERQRIFLKLILIKTVCYFQIVILFMQTISNLGELFPPYKIIYINYYRFFDIKI